MPTPPTILVIDDDPQVRGSLADFLSDSGYEVVQAEDGRAGLDAWQAHQPDLVLVDLRMPVLDGLSVIRAITASGLGTPVIVVSGTGVLRDAVAALREGAWDYLTKPLEDMGALEHTVERCLERARLLAENEAYRAGLEARIAERTSELRTAYDQISGMMEATVDSLSRVTNLKDAYTGTHQARVTVLATAMARRLGMPVDEVEAVRVAGMLHDIGKLCIPAQYLLKPTVLDTHEMAFMRQHPQFGHDILESIPFPHPVARMVLQHHERLDGSGYPHGIAGGALLQGARILGVADVAEAMCSHRPYRPAHCLEEAMDELSAGSGTLYAADVVDACLDLLRGNHADMPDVAEVLRQLRSGDAVCS